MIACQGFAEKISADTGFSHSYGWRTRIRRVAYSERCPFEPFGKGAGGRRLVSYFVHMSDKIPSVFERNYFRRWLKIVENLQNRR